MASSCLWTIGRHTRSTVAWRQHDAPRRDSLDDVNARVRAHLAALVRRLRAPALRSLGGLMPRVAARIDPAETAAYEEAVNEAFRAATLEDPRPLGLAPPAKPLVPTPPAEASASMSGAARPLAYGSAPATHGAAAAVESAQEPTTAERLAPWRRQQAADTVPDFLLQTPTRVTPVADDFFEGLIRRVEGDR